MRIAVVVTQMNGNMRERRESERERKSTIRIVERMIIPLMIGRGLIYFASYFAYSGIIHT